MPRQSFSMQTVTISHAVQEPPDLELRIHVLAANAPHVFAAAFW